MSYAIIRNKNYKMGQLPYLYRHNERKNTDYKNRNIKRQYSYKNYSLKKPISSYQKTFEILKKEYKLKGQIKKVSNVLCELVVTSDKDFFERIGEKETRRYFETAYKFVANYQNLGEKFIVSAKVHLDETTPHLHIMYIPVIDTKDKKERPIKKISCSEFWKGKDSYGKLQDNFYKYITKSGFDLERGNTKNNEHIPIEKFKKITNYEVQEMFKDTNFLEQEKTTDNVELIRNDYRRVIHKFNTLAKRYTRIKHIVEETMYKTEQVQEENYALKQENQELKKELITLKDYIDKTFEYVSLMFDFSKERLKRLVNTFISSLNKEK